jgi:hypothetical protein
MLTDFGGGMLQKQNILQSVIKDKSPEINHRCLHWPLRGNVCRSATENLFKESKLFENYEALCTNSLTDTLTALMYLLLPSQSVSKGTRYPSAIT